MQISIKSDDTSSDPFHVKNGIKQRCVMGPYFICYLLLFKILIDFFFVDEVIQIWLYWSESWIVYRKHIHKIHSTKNVLEIYTVSKKNTNICLINVIYQVKRS